MSAIALEMQSGLRRLAEPIPAGDSVKQQIVRAARAAGLGYWRASDIWYGKARRIDAHELEAVRVARLRKTEEKNHELSAIAADFEALAERIALLAAGVDRSEADRARVLAGRIRGLAASDGLTAGAPLRRRA